MKMQRSDNYEFDRRSRLVSVAYDVLRDLKTPADATDKAMLSLLSQAFFAKASAPAEEEPLKVSESKPVSMFSQNPLARRRAH
jgi:hypothetical protein